MPFNGAGTFVRIYQWVQDAANNIYVNATRTDTDTNDIADGLTNCVTRDGQSPFLADVPAGGFKITGLAAGTVSGDAVEYDQIQGLFANATFTGTTTVDDLAVGGNTTMAGTLAVTGNVDMTTGVLTAATQSPGNNTTRVATTAFVTAAAFSTALPSQTGNSGKVTTTDGSSASWATLATVVGDHEVVVTTGNGHGSTNTMIRRFSATQSSTGTAITYADSAANGGSFTINETGMYSIYYLDGKSGSQAYFGISVNSAQLTTIVTTITAANRLTLAANVANLANAASKTVLLTAGDVIRAHTDGTPDLTGVFQTVFSIRKVL